LNKKSTDEGTNVVSTWQSTGDCVGCNTTHTTDGGGDGDGGGGAAGGRLTTAVGRR